jgi:BASS family bile acid:Na+ symporter
MNLVYDIALPVSLAAMMFSLGLALEVADFVRVFRYPKALLVALASLLVVVPALGIAVAHMAATRPVLAVGIFLISTCPGGTLSNLLTFWGRGDLALSISMTALGSVIYVLLAPVWIALGYAVFMHGSQNVALSSFETVVSVGRIALLPVALGMAARAYLPRLRTAIETALRNTAAATVIAIFLLIMWQERHTLLDAIGLAWPAVVVLNISMVATGYLMARTFRVVEAQRTAIVCEHAVRQEGLAIFIAASLLSQPAMALPLILNSATGFVVGMAYLGLHRVLARWGQSNTPVYLSSAKGP